MSRNYVNRNIGERLTVASARAYLLEWTRLGLTLGLIYRPAA